MTGFEFGDVVLVRFPFTDQTATKKRPAAVVSSAEYHRRRRDVIILAITSQIRSGTFFGEAAVTRWREAGLLKPSVLKPVLATIDQDLVLRVLGRLAQPDREALSRIVREILGG
ncbi:MAG: type II toxin-antitoxin system PemK/MazF family toxin [Candidatus Dadabacteria bacterium]|nr:MAG: type II toxin-antitoxin system PemK/MazF family toxin [Candidatus Dadabacteria bacterium]